MMSACGSGTSGPRVSVWRRASTVRGRCTTHEVVGRSRKRVQIDEEDLLLLRDLLQVLDVDGVGLPARRGAKRRDKVSDVDEQREAERAAGEDGPREGLLGKGAHGAKRPAAGVLVRLAVGVAAGARLGAQVSALVTRRERAGRETHRMSCG